jgi:hypothetical protein
VILVIIVAFFVIVVASTYEFAIQALVLADPSSCRFVVPTICFFMVSKANVRVTRGTSFAKCLVPSPIRIDDNRLPGR